MLLFDPPSVSPSPYLKKRRILYIEGREKKQRKRRKTMPLTSPSNPSLCSSPSLSKPRFHLFRHHSPKLTQYLSPQVYISCTGLRNQSIFTVRASPATESQPPKSEGEGEEKFEEYEVVIEKPYGLKFTKGRGGGTYIDAIAPGTSADNAGVFSVGDRVIATSAVFGEEIWPAAEYGRTMYTIRQRIGPLLMKMERRFGKGADTGELTEKEIIRAERNSGVISNRVREIQMQNAMRKMEQKQNRQENLREGLKLYKSGKYEEALDKFETVLGLKPEIEEVAIASYNVACCYSKLNQLQAGLSALEDAMKAGFEDFKAIRTDPDLENLRTSEEFEPLLKKFDESFINENAINAIKSLFGFGKK